MRPPPVIDDAKAEVPMVSVHLVCTTSLLPYRSTIARVKVPDGCPKSQRFLLEADETIGTKLGLRVADALVEPSEDGLTCVMISNPTGFTQNIKEGTTIGILREVEVVRPTPVIGSSVKPVCQVSSDQQVAHTPSATEDGEGGGSRRSKLLAAIEHSELPNGDKDKLLNFLTDHHQAFCLDPGERGETTLTQLEIDTGDSHPQSQPARRMPLAVRREVARQLEAMQNEGVIQPSRSPWASPVVLVRKKDGTHRFCVDYRRLNSVTKADTYPLPRIDDLLDQLGLAKYFTTLDLAAGYWQIRVHQGSQEKTAFVTPQGLFEFRVMPFGLCNAPAVFQRLMQQVLQGLNPAEGPDFVSVYLDDVLVFSQTLEEHLEHLKRVIERIEEVGLKLKPTKCKFVRKEVEYLGHIITPEGLRPNPKLVTAVREYPTPRDIHGLRRFLGMASYYRRFIAGFARIAEPLHQQTRKDVVFQWTPECQLAFETLKAKLTTAPVLAYPAFDKDFVLETDASIQGLGAVLSQHTDGKLHPVAYASRALSKPEKNYGITELETLAVVWAITHYRHCLYGRSVTVYTDHSAVKAVLETPNPSGKHARWWNKVYGSGISKVHIVYRSGKDNKCADALSRDPVDPAPKIETVPVTEVATLQSEDITTLLGKGAPTDIPVEQSFEECQQNDSWIRQLTLYLMRKELPEADDEARKIVLQAPNFTIVDSILYFIDNKRDHRKRAVVPTSLQQQLIRENHGGRFGGHFSGLRTYAKMALCWWWDRMYSDIMEFCKVCPECVTVSGVGRRHKPPLHPIPVSRPFQILGVDLMELPKTSSGNRYVVVFQDMFTKWPFVFPVPDQQSVRIVKFLAEQVIPFCGVPEALLSDRGANLLSHLMLDVCETLGIKKLNTTAYHPQCDGMVERFNRTLKAMLRKHSQDFGKQWDRYLPGLLWAYRNMPHESTREKPSYLLFGFDCRSPSEACLLPPSSVEPTNLDDYREELALSLRSARDLAAKSIQTAQKKYKKYYDQNTSIVRYRVGHWILIKFPQDETGKNRKLSRPWHGPYRVTAVEEPNVTATNVYFPDDKPIRVHQSRVCPCPVEFPAGYYWYGGKRQGIGQPPRWIEQLTTATPAKETDEDHDECITPTQVDNNPRYSLRSTVKKADSRHVT